MKKLFFLPALIFSFFSLLAQPESYNLEGSIKKGKLTLNKITINKTWKLQPCLKFLGVDRDRKRDGYNITHTYDDYGIVFFERKRDEKATDTISEVQFYFSEPERNNVTPTGYFIGNFTIDKMKISDVMTPADLKNLDGYTQTDSYMEHNFRYAKDGLYIYFLFSTDETRLQKMSIGKDMRPKTSN